MQATRHMRAATTSGVTSYACSRPAGLYHVGAQVGPSTSLHCIHSRQRQGTCRALSRKPCTTIKCVQSSRSSAPPPQDRAGPLAKRPGAAPANTPTVFLEMTQVVDKDVITRTSGRNLGTVSEMWVDPVKKEVMSLDLDEKKSLTSVKVANIPLSSLRQIGDVVLVHDETVLYEQDLDGRYGYVLLTGMEVRTRSGDFLGKVRPLAP